ncbi:hypothetical protein ScPMuIL_006697 [Solemya velum]
MESLHNNIKCLSKYQSLLLLIFGSIAVCVRADGGCLTGWEPFNDRCLMFSTQKLTRLQAEQECLHFQGSLLQLNITSETSSFMSLAAQTQDYRWWTDLNELNHPGTYLWGNSGAPVRPTWNQEPDDISHLENCGALNVQGGFSDEKCSEKHGYICEIQHTDGGCPEYWLFGNMSCYLISDTSDPYQLLTWSQANQRCVNKTAKLMTLETSNERKYLSGELPYLSKSAQVWWVGMRDQAQEGHWLWVDGSPVNTSILTWAVEPNNLAGIEHCGAVYRNGKFADLPCNNTEKYVCQTTKTGATPMTNTLGCPVDWLRAGHKCYMFQQTKKRTWQQSQDDCVSHGARLLQVQSMDERIWIELETRVQQSGLFWTGMNDRDQEGVYKWTDGSAVDASLIRWNGEPNNFKGSEDCAIVIQDNTFNDLSCYQKAGFICEFTTEDDPCPTGWLSRDRVDDTDCYYISAITSNSTVTWFEARDKCNRLSAPHTSFLLAINTQSELTYIGQHLKSLPYQTASGWWTGLNDRAVEGVWQYDQSYNRGAPSLIPWNTEPRDDDGTNDCVVIYYGGRYNDVRCSDNANFICEKSLNAGAPASEFTAMTIFLCVLQAVLM